MDFANYEEQKILLALYCINQGRTDCECTRECDEGTCLCMDEEQLALLDQLLGTLICCEVEDGETGKFQAKEYKEDVPFCEKKNDVSKRLIENFRMESEEIQSAISSTLGTAEKEVWEEVFCGLPLLQMVNIRCKLTCRASIAYWCLFGEDSGEFLEKLLKALCVCAISRKLKGQDVKCVADYMEAIFGKISELYEEQEFEECCRKFTDSILQYENKFREQKGSLRIGVSPLKELYSRINGAVAKRRETPSVLTYILEENEASMNELIQLYQLVENVFSLFGVEMGQATKSFWNVKLENETSHLQYSRFQEVFEHISDKTAEIQASMWRQFVFLITGVDECSTENVEFFCEKYL